MVSIPLVIDNGDVAGLTGKDYSPMFFAVDEAIFDNLHEACSGEVAGNATFHWHKLPIDLIVVSDAFGLLLS